MLGWFSDASIRASRSRRASRFTSLVSPGARILIATSRPSLCRARGTPLPSRRRPTTPATRSRQACDQSSTPIARSSRDPPAQPARDRRVIHRDQPRTVTRHRAATLIAVAGLAKKGGCAHRRLARWRRERAPRSVSSDQVHEDRRRCGWAAVIVAPFKRLPVFTVGFRFTGRGFLSPPIGPS